MDSQSEVLILIDYFGVIASGFSIDSHPSSHFGSEMGGLFWVSVQIHVLFGFNFCGERFLIHELLTFQANMYSYISRDLLFWMYFVGKQAIASVDQREKEEKRHGRL